MKKTLLQLSVWKTLRFNLKYFPFRQAVRLPVVVSRHCRIRSLGGSVRIEGDIWPGMIRLGFDGVGIFDNKRSRFIWQVDGQVIFTGAATIGHGSKIGVGKEGVLRFGNNFNITAESSIVSNKSISFGDNFLCSWECLIMDTDFHSIEDRSGRRINPDAEIVFGNNVWGGCRSTILKGANLPDGTIVAAGSMVSKNTPSPSAIIGGNPAKVIKTDTTWRL